jgi:thermitase
MRVWLGLLGTILCACASAQPVRQTPIAYDAERDAYYVADELVVGLEPNAPGALAFEVMRWVSHSCERLAPLGASVLRLNRATDAESVRDLLLALPGVRYVERNYLVFTCNDPLSSQQWGLTRIQAAQAWAIATPQRTVYLAIIDTGVDATHPDLAQRVRRYSNGTVYGYNTQLNNANTHDFHGHGTHCAGIAAAHTGNGVGIAGVASTAPVQIMPVKVLNDQGIGTMTDVARGIIWAADNGAHVLSLSLGGNAGTQQLADAVNYAWNRGCVVVAAAGNNGSNAPFYPAAYENALAVAASDPNDRLTDFSQYGTWVDIAAPGSSILSTVPGNRYEAWSGTSMACPHVAGAAALIWSCVPSLTNQQLRLALENNADPVQPYWFGGIGEGKGRLNLYRALQAALQMENTPTVSQLTLSPTSVTAGGTARGTVVLSRPAGAGGTVVELRSSNPTLAWCAAQITIPQGQTTGVFDIRTAANGAGSATITASSGGVSRTATLHAGCHSPCRPARTRDTDRCAQRLPSQHNADNQSACADIANTVAINCGGGQQRDGECASEWERAAWWAVAAREPQQPKSRVDTQSGLCACGDAFRAVHGLHLSRARCCQRTNHSRHRRRVAFGDTDGTLSPSVAASASPAPVRNATGAPYRCHSQPNSTLAGSAATPTTKWNSPYACPRWSGGAKSATSARSAPSVSA